MNERIISLLNKEKDYLSGQEISRTLGLSRTAIWKHIGQLRQEGYVIEAVSRKGYRLVVTPDKLLPMEIRNGLKTKVFGKDIIYHEIVASTMDEATRLGFEGKSEGTVICADGQTKGRGRLGRDWQSFKGKGIYCSIILRPRISVAEASRLTLIFAVAVCEAIRSQTGLKAVIKWPNDILVKGKKIAGILTELNAEMDRIHFIVVGIGMNVNEGKSELLKSATSVFEQKKTKTSRVAFLQELLRKAEENYFLFQNKGFLPLREKWREMSSTLDQQVKVIEGKNVLEGKAIDMDIDGGLLIETKNGQVIKRMAGDVFHLR